jgi:hypothetical protein
MAYTVRHKRELDPNDPVQMDAFNEEYAKACKFLGVERETTLVTFEQGARYLDLSPSTVMRYAWANPPLLDLEKVSGMRRNSVLLTLDSVVEYKLYPRFYDVYTHAKK